MSDTPQTPSPVSPLLSPEEAWRRLEPFLETLDAKTVPRHEALGRVLAAAEAARLDLPAFDVAAMDGYAVAEEPAVGDTLLVTGTQAAGRPARAAPVPGTAIRIMTGSPVPTGTRRILPLEITDGGTERMAVRAAPGVRTHIRRRGEVARAGDELLPAGTPLTAEALALLASQGIGSVHVVRRPRVAVLTTGDEVVAPEEEPAPGQIRDSHTDFLRAALARLGLPITLLGIAPDRAESLRARVAEGLGADVLIVCGGVSKGDYDLVAGILAAAGGEPLFHGVAIQPGKPLAAFRHRGGLAFGLPGNPASVAVTFRLFVRPALRRLAGHDDAFWRHAVEGQLSGELPGAGARDRFVPAAVAAERRRLQVRPLPPAGSHDLVAFGRANALVRVRAGSAPTGDGGACELLLLE